MSASGVSLKHVALYDNIPTYGNGIDVNIQEISNVLITVMMPTEVTLYTLPALRTGGYAIYTTFSVVTTNTTITLHLTWTDEHHTTTSQAILTTPMLAFGASYAESPYYFHAVEGTTITLTATANHANTVYVSSECHII